MKTQSVTFTGRLLLLAICFFLGSSSLSAASYYFSTTNGDDTRTAAQAQNAATPWKSLTKLNAVMSTLASGDFIYFKRGDVFYGSITITKSGLTFSAYDAGANPIITGFQDLSFTSIGANKWESQVLAIKPNIVVEDDIQQLPARYPNSGYLFFENSSGSNQITDNELTGNWTGGEVVVRKNNTVLDKGTITAQTGGTLTYTFISPDGHVNGNGYFIQNHVNALDLNGEWVYSGGKITVYSTATPVNWKAAQVKTIVSLNGFPATFESIAFEGSNEFGFNILNAPGTIIQNCSINNNGVFGVRLNNATSTRIENTAIHTSNNCAIIAQGTQNLVIRGNSIRNSGIEGRGESLTITSLEYSAISLDGCSGSIVERNDVIKTGYNAINFMFANNIVIQNNFVDSFNISKDDGGGIYTWNGGGNPDYLNIQILNNIVINGVGAVDALNVNDRWKVTTYGIYLDNNSANITIGGNTVANNGGSGIFIHNSNKTTITNNICYNNGVHPLIDESFAGQIQFLNDDNSWIIRNITMTGNQLVSRPANQIVLKWDSRTNDISQAGTFNNNYYARPISDNQMSRVYVNGWPTSNFYSLAGWKTYSGLDVNSVGSPQTITTLNNLRFEYNATNSSKTVNLGATYIDIKGVQYSGSITLAPYSSAVLIYKSGVVANQAPTANAGANQTITLPTNTVTLTGTGTDADGTIASYLWTKIAGPATFTIASSATTQTAVNNLIQGTYQFELRVTDNTGATGRDTIVVTVNAAPVVNQAPTANAGVNQTITLPTNTVTLTGSGTDVDGTIASYNWTKIAGPATFTIASAATTQTAVNNLIQGTYQFELRVTDNTGATGRDTIVVTVNAAPVVNQAPTANAGVNQTITLPTNTVTLTGTGADVDGTIASYLWTKIAGPATFTIASAATAQTAVNNLVQGTYQFELRVTDNTGATGRDTIVVTVNAAPVVNQAPTANAGVNQTITLPTNTVTLTGTGTDVDGTIASYNWTKIAGPATFTIASAATAQTAVTNLVQGTYQFELRVTDNTGATGRDTIVVTVNAAPVVNQAPTANAGVNQTITLPTNTVTLTGTGTDVDGTIASYNWTKIAGPTGFTIVSSATAQTAVNNLTQGTYQFELRVTDNVGAIGKDTIVIVVNPAPVVNQAPSANAGVNQTITLPTNTVTLTGSGTDVDGTIATYLWTKIAGPLTYTIANASTAQTAVNNLVQGTYQFELRVTDNTGATGRDTIVVTVNPAPVVNQAPTANAGVNQSITLPTNTVTLTGSGTDVDGTIAAYLWTKIAGPATYTIVSSATAQTAVNNLVQGTYQFELRVTDNTGAVGRDTVVIVVNPAPNQLPVANAGASQTITLPVNTTTLTGTGTDADGTISSYLWTMVSGPAACSIVSPLQAQTVVNGLVEGTYQFQLRVTDNRGASATSVVSVVVGLPILPPVCPLPPVALAGDDQVVTLPLNSAILSGTGTDPDGTITTYEWINISGPAQFSLIASTQAQTAVNSLVEGEYQFALKVTDNTGMIGMDTVKITVTTDQNKVAKTLVYPNPATSYINVVVDGKGISSKSLVTIYNANGMIFYQAQLEKTQTTLTKWIDLSRFAKGAYMVEITSPPTRREVIKFVIQ